ncbi:MAG: asparagine synthetase A [Euryarchaeota archaeon]|nr:asparagine synthetase A [Euryarchaeota archaeon]
MIPKREVIMVQNEILTTAREFFTGQGFMEVQSPIISTVTDPGLRGAEIASIDYYGTEMKITSSMIFHKQLAASVFGKVFSLSPNIRLESNKRRETKEHLAEFRQLEIEAANFSYREIMGLTEVFFITLFENLGEKFFLRDLPIEFKEYSYKEIVSKYGLEYGGEIPREMEKRIAGDCFVWITEYPYGSRGFYDKTDKKDPEFLRDFDLLYPHRFGEASSGGEREHEHKKVKKKIVDLGLDPSDFKDYLDILESERIKPTAGLGIGLERLTRFICGLESVEEAVLFPRVPGVPSF